MLRDFTAFVGNRKGKKDHQNSEKHREFSINEVYSSEMKPASFETIIKSKRCTYLGSAADTWYEYTFAVNRN